MGQPFNPLEIPADIAKDTVDELKNLPDTVNNVKTAVQKSAESIKKNGWKPENTRAVGKAVGLAAIAAATDRVTGGLGNNPADKVADVAKAADKASDAVKQAQRLTRQQARDIAKQRGWREVKDFGFNSHGQPVFKFGNKYYTPDVDGHRGGVWKLIDSKGKRYTLDANFNVIGD